MDKYICTPQGMMNSRNGAEASQNTADELGGGDPVLAIHGGRLASDEGKRQMNGAGHHIVVD